MAGADATTIGPDIFIKDRSVGWTTMEHEYVHIMQYPANGSQAFDYIVETVKKGRLGTDE